MNERMATWRDISIDNELAARKLLTDEHWRSCISRAYYAVYAAISGVLREQGLAFGGSRDNPSHGDLPSLVESNVAGLAPWQRRDLKAAARQLYSRRLEADYDDAAAIDMGTARQSVFVMSRALAIIRGGL